jgi:hypothetical protein
MGEIFIVLFTLFAYGVFSSSAIFNSFSPSKMTETFKCAPNIYYPRFKLFPYRTCEYHSGHPISFAFLQNIFRPIHIYFKAFLSVQLNFPQNNFPSILTINSDRWPTAHSTSGQMETSITSSQRIPNQFFIRY